MKIFNLYKTIQFFIPFKKRKPKFIGWIKVYIAYLYYLVATYFQYRDKLDLEIKMTPQVIFLEKFLNSRYGVVSIKIVEGYNLGPWMLHEQNPGETDMYLIEPDNYMYHSDTVATVDFVVEASVALASECPVIAAYVQKFKRAGKSFIIQLK